jgi:DNA-directed RNA polymerase subunit RPC12/RpoP
MIMLCCDKDKYGEPDNIPKPPNNPYWSEQGEKPWNKPEPYGPIPEHKKWIKPDVQPWKYETKPITCPHCGKPCGRTQEDLAYYVIPPEGIVCRQCGHRFMKPTRYWC